MKKSTRCLVSVLAGFVVGTFISFTTDSFKEDVQTKWFVEVAHTGDTFNDIVGQYYDSNIKANKSWDEWQTQQKEYNQQLFANGRALQPGDKILIVTKVRVAK